MSLNLQRPLAVFDLETTGTRIGKDRIVQIGIVRLMPDGTREQYQTLVNPEMPIPAEATAVHGITDLDVASAPTLAMVAREVLDQLAGCDLCGFNVLRFDLPLLSEELSRIRYDWSTNDLRVVDVQRIFHQMEPRDLSAAVRFYCGKDLHGAHDALIDVQATADVLLAQLDRYPDLLKPDIAFLGELSGDLKRNPDPAGKLRFDDRGAICLAFGKYAGWTLENIGRNDPGYLQWLMTKAELPHSTLSVMRNALADLHT